MTSRHGLARRLKALEGERAANDDAPCSFCGISPRDDEPRKYVCSLPRRFGEPEPERPDRPDVCPACRTQLVYRCTVDKKN